MEREQGQGPNWRVRGRVLVAVGLFLVLSMGAIAWNLAPIMVSPGVEVDGSTFAGTAAQGQIFLGLFGLVGLFGAMTVANGAWMMATGRRSPAGTCISMILFLLLFALGWAIRRGLV
jgi:ABC-type Na+ efflux pump permease subunit